MAENAKKIKAIRILKKVCASLWYISVTLLFILLVSIFISKMSGKVPSVFGFSVVKIVSPSMGEEIPTGTYILLRKVDAEDVRENDIICFYSTDPQIHGMPNTHRVVDSPIITENGIEFVTRGDANLKNDDYHAMGDRLIGKYVYKLKLLTALSGFAEGRGVYILSLALVFSAFAMIVFSYMKVGKAEKKSPEKETEEDPRMEK